MRQEVLLAEAACIGSAFCWAVALTLFRQPIADYGARAVNLAKCSLAAVLLGATTLLLGQMDSLWQAEPRELFLVAMSGVIGMSLGDTALFGAVHSLGVHRTLLLQTLAPVFAALLAAGSLGERLGLGELVGALLILGGVALVLTRGSKGRSAGSTLPFSLGGVALALFAALGQGSGIVLVKAGLESLPVLAASFLRLLAASLGLALILAVNRKLQKRVLKKEVLKKGVLRKRVQGVASPTALKRILGPTFLGTYVAILLMMAGIAYAPASIAAVLLATTPVFSLLIDARLEKRGIPLASLLGTLVAVAGVGVLATAR